MKLTKRERKDMPWLIAAGGLVVAVIVCDRGGHGGLSIRGAAGDQRKRRNDAPFTCRPC
jgi:hypothetical protein